MSKVHCPYCKSIQVKAMSNQPKKYPRPTDPVALADWQKGYDCKKCGNDFVVTPPKPIGFLGVISRIVFWLIIVACVVVFFNRNNDTSSDTDEFNSSKLVANKEELKNLNDSTHASVETVDNQEFTQEAEEAAHAYMPTEDDYKNLEQKESQKIHKSDNLTIIETTRGAE